MQKVSNHNVGCDRPDLFEMVWDACHDPSVLELRNKYREEATVSDDELFVMFPELT